MGCNGGWMDQAFSYANIQALETEDQYPYKAHDGDCKYEEGKGKVKVASFVDVAPNDPEQLKAAIRKGPVSIAI